MDPRVMPRNLAEAIARDGRHSWWSTLPGIVRTLAEDWSLEVGAPFQPGGDMAWVAPARGSSGAELVLKLAWRHPESEHEADGLLTWGGNGAFGCTPPRGSKRPTHFSWSVACRAAP